MSRRPGCRAGAVEAARGWFRATAATSRPAPTVPRAQVGLWVEAGDRLLAVDVDVDLGGPAPTPPFRIAIARPAAGDTVASPVSPTLAVDAPGLDGRTSRVCYAVREHRCCALLWTRPEAVDARRGVEIDAAPAPLELPPGEHELVAWVERGDDELLALDARRFVVAAEMFSPQEKGEL